MPRVMLNVPYRSQWDDDAKNHSADCGPTCLTMVLNAIGDAVTPDELYRHIGERGYSEYTSFGDLRQAAHSRAGLQMTRRNFDPATALADLRATIDQGRPFVALANYAMWDDELQNGFRGSHFVLVVGYDDSQVLMHDPLFRGPRREQGAFYAMNHARFSSGWGGFAPHANPNYAVLIAETIVPFADGTVAVAPAPELSARSVDAADSALLRRLRAGAAFYNMTDPDPTNPAAMLLHESELGDFGRSFDLYTIRSGDNLFDIAARFYNDGDKFPVIWHYNGLPNPNDIAVGQVLKIPRPDRARQREARVALPGYGGPMMPQ